MQYWIFLFCPLLPLVLCSMSLVKLGDQIETRYKYSRVILLECPPVSMIRHNKDKGHKHPEIFHNQNGKLLVLCSMSLVKLGDIYINWTVFFAFGQHERFIS
jgi:hypothetical protein